MILNIFYIPSKGSEAIACQRATLIPGKGMLGDIHSTGGDKQLMFVSKTLYDRLNHEEGLCFKRFKPNFVIVDVVVDGYYQIGECTIRIKKHAKKCFEECSRFDKVSCPMKCEIWDGIVVTGGEINVGEKLRFIRGIQG